MKRIYVKHSSWWRGLFRRHEGTVEHPYRTLRRALRSLRGTVIDKHVSIMLSEGDKMTEIATLKIDEMPVESNTASKLGDSAARGLGRKM